MKTDKCLSADHNKSDDLCCSTHNRGFTIKTGTKRNQKPPMQKKLCISRVLEKLQTRSEPLEHARVEVARRYEHTACSWLA